MHNKRLLIITLLWVASALGLFAISHCFAGGAETIALEGLTPEHARQWGDTKSEGILIMFAVALFIGFFVFSFALCGSMLKVVLRIDNKVATKFDIERIENNTATKSDIQTIFSATSKATEIQNQQAIIAQIQAETIERMQEENRKNQEWMRQQIANKE